MNTVAWGWGGSPGKPQAVIIPETLPTPRPLIGSHQHAGIAVPLTPSSHQEIVEKAPSPPVGCRKIPLSPPEGVAKFPSPSGGCRQKSPLPPESVARVRGGDRKATPSLDSGEARADGATVASRGTAQPSAARQWWLRPKHENFRAFRVFGG